MSAALIQRGPNYFCEKIAFAAEAGAALAIVYNNRDGDARILMAETDLSSIPSIFISQNDGEALREGSGRVTGMQVVRNGAKF